MQSDLISIINNKLPDMSKSHKLIGQYILNHSEKAAYLTATKLGENTGVSESTVVRFAIELGFKGYPELQKAIQRHIRTKLTSLQRIEVTDSIIGEADVLTKVLTSDIEKIKLSIEEINRNDFNCAVDAILNAKNIYIIAVRSSSILSSFLHYYFNLIFENVHLIQTTSASEMFERVMRISESDVMIAFSFPRYSKRTRHAVEFAKKHNARVIAITDSESSPIAPIADYLLLAKSEMASFVDSLVAPLSITNALIVAIGRKKKQQLSNTFKQLEEIWEEYEVYEKPNN